MYYELSMPDNLSKETESQPDKSTSRYYYLLLVPAFLVLFMVALSVYYFSKGKSVSQQKSVSPVVKTEIIKSLTGSENIIREGVISLAGNITSVNDGSIVVNRMEQEITLPVSNDTPVYLQVISPEKTVYLDDRSFGTSGSPVNLNTDTKISYKEIKPGDQVLVFLSDNSGEITVKNMYVITRK